MHDVHHHTHHHVHHHTHHHHGDGVPPWAEINGKLDLVINREGTIMSQAEDLNNGMTSLATAFAVEHDAVMKEMDVLAAALANVTDPALSAAASQAIANVALITGQMATDAAALTASIPAATTVPPPTVTAPTTPTTVTVPEIAAAPITAPAASPPSTPPDSAVTTA